MVAAAEPKPQRRRPVLLPSPRSAPPGSLEQVAWLLLHRTIPFNQQVQHYFAALWGLPEPPRSAWLGQDVVNRQTLVARAGGTALRLRRLAEGCPPPASLVRAVQLIRDAPWLTEHQLRSFLALAGLSDGTAGSHLVRALGEMWGLPVPHLWAEDARQARLLLLAKNVRAAGVLSYPEQLNAADVCFLSQRSTAVRESLLVRSEDATSLIARPIRRQLAAVGPLPLQVLIDGAVRECRVKGLTEQRLRAWVSVQPDLAEQAGCVSLKITGRWLRPSDAPVLALFDQQPYVLRADILAALVADGQSLGSAHVWVATCSWFRRAGVRGFYRGPMDPTLPRSDA